MEDTERARQFLGEYAEYVRDVLQPTEREVRELLADWRQPLHWADYSEKSRLPTPSPIERYHTRIKRPESVVDKIHRNPSFFSQGMQPDSFRTMNDAFGARVVVYVLAHLPLINSEIFKNGIFEVASDPPPTVYLGPVGVRPPGLDTLRTVTKPSGYASVHYILRVRDSVVPGPRRPWFELQVRTMMEDVWAEIEHILGYKPLKRTHFAVTRQFQILSGLLQVLDQHFNFLYEELSRFQEEGAFLDSDPLNAENLPAVLAEIQIACAQGEVDGMLKALVSRGVETVGHLRQAAPLSRLELIKDTYLEVEGRLPISFEMVANLATIADAENDSEIRERIRVNIDILKVWRQLREH